MTAADGQTYYGKIKKKTIPYAYGFEDGNPFADGWKLVNGILSTEILHEASDSYEGNYCFKFSNDGSTPQYFISPELDCSTALSMTFYQYALMAPRFKVGYCMATSPDDLSYFEWGDEITGTNESWSSVTRTLPKGTRFVAIQILPVGAGNILFVDNFRFEACSYPAPTGLTLSALTDKTATLEWSAPNANINISSYKWQYKVDGESSWSYEVSTTERSVNLNDLSGYTTYNFQVKAVYSDGEESMWQSISFRTSMSLPYECGFENNGDLGKWTMTDVYWDRTKVYDVRSYDGADQMYACPYNGNRNFTFYSIDNNPHPQYLISPQFNGTKPIQVSFYYRNKQADVWDTFEVGVSYSDNNISSFSWGPEIGAVNGEWRQYDNTFIGGDVKPRYIAIKYTGNREALFVDDVIFSEASSSTKPTKLTVSSVTNQSATLTWTAPTGATGYAYRYKLATGNSWSEGTVTSASVTLTGLSASTSYDFRVKALYASAPASNETEIRFLTEGNAQALPYYERFDSGLGGWRLVDGNGNSGLKSENITFANYYFLFVSNANDQYLISPEFVGDKSIQVSFYHQKVSNDHNEKTKFCVGWSSTTKDISSFTWGPEVEATDNMQNYIIQAPQGTRYVAIKKSAVGDFLRLDDFGFIDSEQYVLSTTPVHAFGEDCFVTTFYHLNYPFQLPEGSRAYTAKQDGEVVFQLIGDDGRIIPNDTPCIIVSDRLPSDPEDATKDIVLKPLSSTDVQAHDGNILRGYSVSIILANEMVEGSHVYVVDVVNGELGFYRFVGDEIPPKKFTSYKNHNHLKC